MPRRGYRVITLEISIAEYEDLFAWAEDEARTPDMQALWALRQALRLRHVPDFLRNMQQVESGISTRSTDNGYPPEGEEPSDAYVAPDPEEVAAAAKRANIRP